VAAFAALIASGLSLGTPEMLPRLFRVAIAAAVSPFPVMYAYIIDAVPEGASPRRHGSRRCWARGVPLGSLLVVEWGFGSDCREDDRQRWHGGCR